MPLKLVTPPDEEPVTVEEVKAHLRIDHDAEDDLLAGFVAAARARLEELLGRSLMPQTWELILDGWPAGQTLALPRPPLLSVESITYRDASGADVVLHPAGYLADPDSEPGRIILPGWLSGQRWPDAALWPLHPVRVRYAAGYAEAESVPAPLRLWLKQAAGWLYERREEADLDQYPVRHLYAWRVWGQGGLAG